MSDLPIFAWSYVHPEYVHLLWAVVAFVGVLIVLELRTRGALSAFLSIRMQRRLTAQASVPVAIAKLSILGLAMACGVLALMRPQVAGETEVIQDNQAAADVLFAIDTSRSMLADDATPNRLARAKAEIATLVEQLPNQRVGLLAFAGRAALICPLTPDRSYFNMALAPVDTRSAGRGGTKLGEAIKGAIKAFPPGPGAKLLVLITDGDDQDQFTDEAAQKARDAGIKIVAIGLGSEAGSQIRITDPQSGAKTVLTKADGTPVVSKLDGEKLRKIALTTEGAYIPAGTQAVDLAAIMKAHVQPMIDQARVKTQRSVPAERYPWYVLAMMVLVLAALLLGAEGAGDRRLA
ncbi:MAG TPA: VWA domain-containing protein [Kofleriaceae bacterium]